MHKHLVHEHPGGRRHYWTLNGTLSNVMQNLSKRGQSNLTNGLQRLTRSTWSGLTSTGVVIFEALNPNLLPVDRKRFNVRSRTSGSRYTLIRLVARTDCWQLPQYQQFSPSKRSGSTKSRKHSWMRRIEQKTVKRERAGQFEDNICFKCSILMGFVRVCATSLDLQNPRCC